MNNSTKLKIKKILAIIACVVVVSTAALFPACACNGQGAAEDFLGNVVSVSSSGEGGDKYGSGVLVCRDGETVVCLTNYHVVSDNNRVLVTPRDGNTVSAELLGYSEYHDIAVLGLTADHGQEFYDLIARAAFAKAGEGTAYSVGDKNNSGVAVYTGECTATGRVVSAETVGNETISKFVPVTEVTCDIGAGMSGCAVLNGGGRLIGIGTYREDDASAYYAVSSSIARRVMEAALRGDKDENGEVKLLGEKAAADGYGAYLYDAYGGAGFLVKRTNKLTLHPLGFAGTFTVEGFQLSEVGADCPLPEGAMVTEIGGVKADTKNMSEVFAAVYGYRLSDGADGAALKVTYMLDGETRSAELKGGDFSLIKR